MEQIRRVTVEDVRQMREQEGLVFLGCGGEVDEWFAWINDLLTEAGVLLEGSRFKMCMVFEHEGLTNILFPFGEEKIAIGKLALWRIATHSVFGGMWLSDYLDIKLGVPQKPEEDVDNDMDF